MGKVFVGSYSGPFGTGSLLPPPLGLSTPTTLAAVLKKYIYKLSTACAKKATLAFIAINSELSAFVVSKLSFF